MNLSLESNPSLKEMFSDPFYRKKLLIGVIAGLTIQTGGFIGILFYSVKIFTS